LSLLVGKGDDLFLAGVITDPDVVPFDINKQVTQIYLAEPDRSADAIVRSVALQWVGEAHTDALCKAWRLCDEACRKRPMYSYSFGHTDYLVAPMVPDESRLSEDEKAYYHRESAFSAGEVKRTAANWVLRSDLRYDESYRTWMLDRFRRVPLPMLTEAEELLRAECRKANNEKARACLDAHARHIGVFHFFLRCQYNWLEAGRYFSPGDGEITFERPIVEIIDDEIASAVRLIELIRARPEQYLSIAELPAPRQLGTEFLSQLQTRIDLMRRHRDDKRP